MVHGNAWKSTVGMHALLTERHLYQIIIELATFDIKNRQTHSADANLI